MAPLPTNNTARYILTYTNGTDNHEISVRYDDSLATASDAAQAINLIFTALETDLVTGFAYISARNQARLSNISLPAALPLTTPSPSGNAPTGFSRAAQITLSGRTTLGRRVLFPIIGVFDEAASTWAIQRGDYSTTDSWLDIMQGIGSPTLPPGTFVGIDGSTIIWYDRITFDYNDYWVRQVRP